MTQLAAKLVWPDLYFHLDLNFESSNLRLYLKVCYQKNKAYIILEELKAIRIVDNSGNPILTKDHDRRFFEAAWIHKHNGTYYLSYSTGNTHYIVYATGDNPYGPFVYQGILNEPVQGWTNHHSTVKIDGKWYLFYHDVEMSGQSNLRNVKYTEFTHNEDGTINPVKTYFGNDFKF